MSKVSIYIDESGQAGIDRISDGASPGATPYMTLGAVLVQDEEYEHHLEVLGQVQRRFNKSFLHATKLQHKQLVSYAKTLASENVVLFGLISYKETLEDYRDRIERDPVKYFNKCAGYLLECVGEHLKQNEICSEDASVVFETGLHDYGKMRSYIRACQNRPIHSRARLLQQIDYGRIIEKSKVEEPLLQYADMVAHSVYQAVNKGTDIYGINETRYLEEMQGRFHAMPNNGAVCQKGLYFVKGINSVGLDQETKRTFQNLRASC